METYSSWQTFFLHLIFFFCSDSQAENSFHQLELAGAAPLPEHRGHRGPAKGLCHRVPSTPPSRDTRGEVGDTRGPVPPSRAVRPFPPPAVVSAFQGLVTALSLRCAPGERSCPQRNGVLNKSGVLKRALFLFQLPKIEFVSGINRI